MGVDRIGLLCYFNDMKKMDLMEYVKRAKERGVSRDCFVRFKIEKMKDGRLVLVRNNVAKNLQDGDLSLGFILDKNGNPIVTEENPVGIMSFDDVEQMLDGCILDWRELMPDDGDDVNLMLGGAELEYSTASELESREYGFSEGSLSLDFLCTERRYRKMGLAQKLLKEADKFATLNAFNYLCGIGIPFDEKFYIENKTLNDWGFCMQYKKICDQQNIRFDPMGAIVNLAILYKRMGFDIYPLASGYFVIEKRPSEVDITKQDADFLKAKKSKLDEDAILFER